MQQSLCWFVASKGLRSHHTEQSTNAEQEFLHSISDLRLLILRMDESLFNLNWSS